MRQYQVMIVEDEDIIRTGIRKLIGEMDLPIRGVSEASSGSVALELMRQEPADIVVTDIRMDDGDGLALIRSMAHAGMRAKSIILSGYGQFAYAQQAITLGVSEYLLKPVKRKALRDALDKLIAQMETESAKPGDRLPEERGPEIEYRHLLAVSIYADGGPVSEKLRAWPCRKLDADGREAVVCAYAAPSRSGGYPALLIGTDDADAAEGRGLHAIIAEALRNEGVEAFVGISEPLAGKSAADRLPQLYEQSAEALDYRLLKGGNGFYYADVCTPPPPISAPSLFAQSIRSTLQDGDGPALSDAVGEWLRFMLGRRESTPTRIIEPLHHLLAYASFVYGGGSEALAGLDELVGMYRSASDIDEFRTCVLARFSAALDGAASRSAPHDSRAISFIISFLDRHYERDITLHDAAGQVFMNPSYFSTLFKKKTGINFIHYLQRLRIEKSKALLADPRLKVYEIAARTGFKDEKYFFKVFKNVTGITPNEYRDRRTM